MYIDDKFVKDYDNLISDRLAKAGLTGDTFDLIKSKVYERILMSNSYDPDKGKITTWLWNICRSVISNEVKKFNRSQDALDDVVNRVHIDDAGSVIGQEDAGSSADELERLFNVSSLSERDLRLVREHHIQGLSMPDVASKYDMETRTVEQVIYRSMKALRQAARDDA